MKTLTWKTIFWNLKMARNRLRRLHCNLHYLAFSELPDDWQGDCSYINQLAIQEKHCPFSEFHLHIELEQIYYNLNLAWNARHVPENRFPVDVEGPNPDFSKESFDALVQTLHDLRQKQWEMARKWGNFPKSREFTDLWPIKIPCRKHRYDASFRKVSLTPVRIGLFQAKCELDLLCALVAKEFLDSSDWSVRFNRFVKEAGNGPLTESEFSCRMHCVFANMNFAWNSRWTKKTVIDEHALRRQHFPVEFLPGSHLVTIFGPASLLQALIDKDTAPSQETAPSY